MAVHASGVVGEGWGLGKMGASGEKVKGAC